MTGEKWMLDYEKHKKECNKIARKAMKLHISGNPDKPAHNLGKIKIKQADGSEKEVIMWVVHAVDIAMTDQQNSKILLIKRRNDPGMGMDALPGGLIDPKKSTDGADIVESAIKAAARETAEETHVDLSGVKGQSIGKRNMNRPFDVRIALDNRMEKYGIQPGDVFMVSTQLVQFKVNDLSKYHPMPGDDADPTPGSTRFEDLNPEKIRRDKFGIKDHYDMIVAAFPDKFPHGLKGFFHSRLKQFFHNHSSKKPVKNIFIATGSFQPPIHEGQIQYLKAAYQRFLEAQKTVPDARFFVLTGPMDRDLLPGQATFFERRDELSEKTGIPPDAFKPHEGRPKLGKKSAEAWRDHFFDPLLPSGITPDQCQIIAVKKADDISTSNNTGGVHYLDWLQQKWPDAVVTDITSEMNHLDLSSSTLRLKSSVKLSSSPYSPPGRPRTKG